MSEACGRSRGQNAAKQQKAREKRFMELTDRMMELLENAMEAENVDSKDFKQITGAMKDLKELIFEKPTEEKKPTEGMLIKIEGDIE